jgi:glycosidase
VTDWALDAVFYHIYPLGLVGAPHKNDFSATPVPRLDQIIPWLDHLAGLGATAVYLGPVMESSSHGYDTADFFQVDRRLGNREAMVRLAQAVHARGLRLVLDGVFHHVGRDFWAFKDVLAEGPSSRFSGWFHLDFGRPSPLGDPFFYEGWKGHFDLVRLDLDNPEVRSHIFEAVATWLRDYHIDGLRLDAADSLDFGFLAALSTHCRRLRDDFWLMGEILQGDYRRWIEQGGLDAVTNYECYKGLFSSHVDRNYFEIAHSLRRQFVDYGLYRGLNLYSFVDNHDVDRVAASLSDPAHLYPLYCLLFTMPGTPSIYYGSEFGLSVRKTPPDDWPLRPALDLDRVRADAPQPDLPAVIARLAGLRRDFLSLRQGDYGELAVGPDHLVFSRATPGELVVVAVSASDRPLDLAVTLPERVNGRLVDRLNPGEEFVVKDGRTTLTPLWPCWARIMEFKPAA